LNKIADYINILANDFLHVLFPDLCLACRKLPKTRDASFCVDCLHIMPYTDHFFIKENDVTKHFRGRVPLLHGGALLRFREGGIVQNMLHQLKYKKRREIGEVLGEIAGRKFLDSPLFMVPDIIIPVPVHPEKVLRRGYNQSSVFGMAVSQVIGAPLSDHILIKDKETTSQTGKSRTERVVNVEEVFVMKRPEEIHGRNVLLVDDVVTTGATLEACCLKLKESGAKSLSILTIAAAD